MFHQNGILLNRVDFKSDVEKYGDLISTSQNGLNFIFKKAKFDFEDQQFSMKETVLQRVVNVSSSSPDKTMKKVPSFED